MPEIFVLNNQPFICNKVLSFNNPDFIPVTRIAPTPSGLLHLGNLVNFILTWLVAKANGGKIYLRIDDMDEQRTRTAYLDDIFRQLEKLGIQPDGGPSGTEEHLRNFSQRLRIERYLMALDLLKKQGNTFVCRCSRKDLAISNSSGYPGLCLGKNIPHETGKTSIRFRNDGDELVKMTDLFGRQHAMQVSDSMLNPILLQKNGLPAYQLTTVCDDEDMGINCIIRGMDLMPSTLFQLHLARQLHYSGFLNSRFYHHELIADEDGKKLSKSQGSAPAKELSKKDILEFFAQWMGWKISPEKLDDLLDHVVSKG